MYTCYIESFKILASFCSWAGWFESDLVKNLRRHIFAWCSSVDLLFSQKWKYSDLLLQVWLLNRTTVSDLVSIFNYINRASSWDYGTYHIGDQRSLRPLIGPLIVNLKSWWPSKICLLYNFLYKFWWPIENGERDKSVPAHPFDDRGTTLSGHYGQVIKGTNL